MSNSPPAPRRRPLSFGSVRSVQATSPTDDSNDSERISWATWDHIEGTRVLILAYTSGLQIWDTSNLVAVREILNLKTESLHIAGQVQSALVLPEPVDGPDDFANSRPLLGIVSPTHLTVFSLSTYSVIKQLPFTDASNVVARPTFIVIATRHPSTLHVLSTRTLQSIHTITLSTSPIFALSHRLLAYVCPTPIPHMPGPPPPTFIAQTRDSLGSSVMRVGGEVWSGVKAAVSSTPINFTAPENDQPWGFSRSAPASSSIRGRWPHDDDAQASTSATAGWVAILDLKPLLSGGSPKRVTLFAPFPFDSAGIAHLAFNAPGAMPMLSVAPRDGQRVAVFQIRIGQEARPEGNDSTFAPSSAMSWHWYDLRRGLTNAHVENIEWESSGRWAAVVTARRTIHIFATNPYGGRPDEKSHLSARIHNATRLQPLSTEITPLVRIRPNANNANLPDDLVEYSSLIFSFLPTSMSRALPPSLFPSPSHSPASSPRFQSSISPTPFQDMLVFDPATGELSLRRITLDVVAPPLDSSGMPHTVSAPGAVSGYSISLPVPVMNMGMSLVRKTRKEAGDVHGEVVGKESTVATWSLKRAKDWPDVRGAVKTDKAVETNFFLLTRRHSYLSQAELSTHSRSPAVLPRPIYLAHQFSFYAFKEDYQALLRRSQLNVPCTKLEVRKDVEVSAHLEDAESDVFLHDTVDLQVASTTPRSARNPFDEPIASAMRSGLDYSGQSPPVLPMLPNGAPVSVLEAIPIHTKHVAAGVNEGFGRIRREIGKVRSPILRPTPGGAGTGPGPLAGEGRHVPLEFDEADEMMFLQGDEMAERDDNEGLQRDDGSGSGASASASVSTPGSRSHADLVVDEQEEAIWDAWDDEARATVAEAEMFDEISVTGFMDEESDIAPIMAAMSRAKEKSKGPGRKMH
ncbi:hypothetical protein BU17DRAFT_44501 [Hysterangium stoloniferum]|nr:hypothetical protein BU17DRAFT_44501 [Hysterangium stoloniferum]